MVKTIPAAVAISGEESRKQRRLLLKLKKYTNGMSGTVTYNAISFSTLN